VTLIPYLHLHQIPPRCPSLLPFFLVSSVLPLTPFDTIDLNAFGDTPTARVLPKHGNAFCRSLDRRDDTILEEREREREREHPREMAVQRRIRSSRWQPNFLLRAFYTFQTLIFYSLCHDSELSSASETDI